MLRIDVYPAYDARYYGHFAEALTKIADSVNIRFTRSGFPDFGSDCLALRLVGSEEKHIYIHANDHPELDTIGLEWADVFGKVNLDPNLVEPHDRDKVVAMGPTFPFHTRSRLATWSHCFRTAWLARVRGNRLRRHLAAYRRFVGTRFPEAAYKPGASRSDYIFFSAALWEREPEGNLIRGNFVEAVRSFPGIHFEGGLIPRRSARGSPDWAAPGFESYFGPSYTPREYLEKTRVSALAFNNPAYRDCHSWRLAECLSLGKALISTPLRRAMPAPLVHREHVHYVDGTVDSIRDAMEEILGNEAYRKSLENAARAYYERYLHPRQVMRRLLAIAQGAQHDMTEPVTQVAFQPQWQGLRDPSAAPAQTDVTA